MNSGTVFLLGAVGALAPEVVRLYSMRNSRGRFRWSWFYVVVSVLFACLGGVVALSLPAVTYWSAIYTGVSTPVLINTILKKVRKERQHKSLQEPPPFSTVPRGGGEVPGSPRKVSFWNFVEGL